MPRGHRRTTNNFENVADRRNRTMFRRSSDPNRDKLSSKEPQISVLVLRKFDQRYIIFTLVSLELDAYWKLVTFLPWLKGSEWRSQLGTRACSEVDGLESVSPPTIIFPVNVQKEQRIDLHDGTSPKSSAVCSSSGAHILPQPHNRVKRVKSVKSLSNMSSCLVEEGSSGPECDSLNVVGLDALVNGVPNLDKCVKKSSRKKGKKKRKQFKTDNKVSTALEGQCEESFCGASIVQSSIGGDPTCLVEHISYPSTFKSLSVQESTTEKDDSENNTDYTDSSTTLMSCISYNDEMDVYEPSAQGFSGEGYRSRSTADPNSTSSAKQLLGETLSTVNVNIHSSNISTDQYGDAPVMDSLQHCWNSGSSTNCSDVETRLSLKDEGGVSLSGGMISNARYHDSSFHQATMKSCVTDSIMSSASPISHPYWSKDVVNTHRIIESSQCNSEACSNNDFHPVIAGKRGRTSSKVASNTGRYNNHPIWQKVQKMDTEQNAHIVSSKVNSSSNDSQTRARPDKVLGRKKTQKGKTSRHSCPHEMISQTSKTSPFKLAPTAVDSIGIKVKRNPSSGSKKADNTSRKESRNGHNELVRPRSHVQQKEEIKILPQVVDKNRMSTAPSPPCSTDSPNLMVKAVEKIGFCQSEQQRKMSECMDEDTSLGNICSTICEIASTTACNQVGSSPSMLNFLDHTCITVHSDRSSFGCYEDTHEVMDDQGKQVRKSQSGSSQVECNKPDSSSVPVSQKWVPVGRRDSMVSNMTHIDNLTDVVHNALPNELDIENAEGEASSDANHFHSIVGDHLRCLNPTTDETTGKIRTHLHTAGEVVCGLTVSTSTNKERDCSSPTTSKLEGILRSHPYTAEEFAGMLASSNCQSTHEMKYKGNPGFDTDLDKIIKAVDDVQNLQTTNGIHCANDSLIADFEIFINSASPVISQRYDRSSCKICSPEQLTCNSLCLHQISNTSLSSLWQWYEEPGCYGLPVKAVDYCNLKKLHSDCYEFSAFFVPYLSAVQLFGRSSASCSSSSASCEVDKPSKSSAYLGSLPIFSMLLPEPHKEVNACPVTCSSSNEEFSNQSSTGRDLGDGKLIFEYFEYDQPPQRRPLFEKVKELAGGEVSSNCHIYGDPLKLQCLDLHDLHPASWYSVAWYPIYRIPQGNFRAAFLTYHSLGHFVKQNPSSNMASDSTRIVNPVVGLQSYNAKKECWFQPRGSKSEVIQTEVPSCLRPEILEERLRTLEQTASVMSTASVCKGNEKSVNKHPDYNHFFSRW